MQKLYSIVADGNTRELQKALKKYKGMQIGILRDYVSAQIPESDKATYLKIKDLFEEYSQRFQFDYSFEFIAIDYIPQDLESADAVGVQLPSVGGQSADDQYRWVTIENKGFSRLETCRKCGRGVAIWEGAGTLGIASKKHFSLPYFTPVPDGIPVLRADVMERLQKQELLAHVHVRECEVLTEETIRDRYFAIYPEIDLGEPNGDIEFLEPCPGCGRRNLRHVREFLLPFSRERFAAANIATTSWFSAAGFLVVTPPVYLILREYLEEAKEKHDETFEPLALI